MLGYQELGFGWTLGFRRGGLLLSKSFAAGLLGLAGKSCKEGTKASGALAIGASYLSSAFYSVWVWVLVIFDQY